MLDQSEVFAETKIQVNISPMEINELGCCCAAYLYFFLADGVLLYWNGTIALAAGVVGMWATIREKMTKHACM